MRRSQSSVQIVFKRSYLVSILYLIKIYLSQIFFFKSNFKSYPFSRGLTTDLRSYSRSILYMYMLFRLINANGNVLSLKHLHSPFTRTLSYINKYVHFQQV